MSAVLSDGERLTLDRLREARDHAQALEQPGALVAAIEQAAAEVYARVGARALGAVEQAELVAEQLAAATDALDGVTRRGATTKASTRKDGTRTITVTLPATPEPEPEAEAEPEVEPTGPTELQRRP